MSDNPATVLDWQQLVPPFEVLYQRFMVLERGMIGGKHWWRIVIIDQTDGGARELLSTGRTVWESPLDTHRETTAKNIFNKIPEMCETLTRDALLRHLIWDSLIEIRGRDFPRPHFLGQLDLLQKIREAQGSALEIALRLMRNRNVVFKTDDNEGESRLALAVSAALGRIPYM